MRGLAPLSRGDTTARRLSLKPLSDDQLSAWMQAQHGIEPVVAMRLARRAGGNPLFAHLLVASGEADQHDATLHSATTGELPERLGALMQDQMAASLDRDAWADSVLTEEYNRLRADVSAAVKRGDRQDAERAIQESIAKRLY